MSRVITLIPGDGIGPEVTEAVVRIFRAASLDIEWERYDAGVTAFKRFNQSLPAELLDSIRRNKVALKGPVTTPIAEGITSVAFSAAAAPQIPRPSGIRVCGEGLPE